MDLPLPINSFALISMASMKRFLCFLFVATIVRGEETLQSTCFKDLPIYRSNSPYGVERKDEEICITHSRGKTFFSRVDRSMVVRFEVSNVDETLENRTFATSLAGRALNANSSVALSAEIPRNLSQYEVDERCFLCFSHRFADVSGRFDDLQTNVDDSVQVLGLLVTRRVVQQPSLFEVSADQSVSFERSFPLNRRFPSAFMNDFTSTCDQAVTATTCLESLSTIPYQTLCFAEVTFSLSTIETNFPKFRFFSRRGIFLVSGEKTSIGWSNFSRVVSVNRSGLCCTSPVAQTQVLATTCSNVIQSVRFLERRNVSTFRGDFAVDTEHFLFESNWNHRMYGNDRPGHGDDRHSVSTNVQREILLRESSRSQKESARHSS